MVHTWLESCAGPRPTERKSLGSDTIRGHSVHYSNPGKAKPAIGRHSDKQKQGKQLVSGAKQKWTCCHNGRQRILKQEILRISDQVNLVNRCRSPATGIEFRNIPVPGVGELKRAGMTQLQGGSGPCAD